MRVCGLRSYGKNNMLRLVEDYAATAEQYLNDSPHLYRMSFNIGVHQAPAVLPWNWRR